MGIRFISRTLDITFPNSVSDGEGYPTPHNNESLKVKIETQNKTSKIGIFFRTILRALTTYHK